MIKKEPYGQDFEPKLEGKSVFITGANGFLGKAIVRMLIRQRASVRALDLTFEQPVQNPPEGFIAQKADVLDSSALNALATGADIAVHLAGLPSVAKSFDMPAEYVRVHVGGTIAMLETCRTAGIRRMVYVSSAEVYGQPESNPVREDYPANAHSPYGAAKIGAEQMARAYARAYGLQSVILRPFSIYGPGIPSYTFLATLLSQVRHDEEVVLADFRPVRDYCYVDDVAEAVITACVAELPNLSIFNIGSGHGISTLELARHTLAVSGRDLPIREAPMRRRPGSADILELVADPSRASELLRWRAETTLQNGLEKTMNTFSGCLDH